MSNVISRNPGKTFAAVGTIGFLFSPLNTSIPLPNPFRTTAVKSIEDRYTAVGGTPSHMPATASKLGDKNAVMGKSQEKQKGTGTPAFEEGIMDQRPEPGPFDKVWNKTNSGRERGK